MPLWLLAALALALDNRWAAAQQAVLTIHQDFDSPGTPYVLAQHYNPPGPQVASGAQGSFLRLTQGTNYEVEDTDELNAVLFDGAASARRVIVDFDYRMITPTHRDRSDGLSFVLLDGQRLDLSAGPPRYYAEEPSVPYGFGVGLDIYMNRGSWLDPRFMPGAVFFDDPDDNHVSVHANGQRLAAFPVDPSVLDLVSGEEFHHVHVELAAASGRYALTLTLTDASGHSVTPVSAFPVPGLPAFAARVCLAARVGRAGATQDIDNVHVQFLDAVDGTEGLPGEWTEEPVPAHIPIALDGPAQVREGAVVSVPVRADMTGTGFRLGAYEAVLRWPAEHFELVQVRPGPFSEVSVQDRFVPYGQLTFSGLNADGMDGTVELATVDLRVRGAAGAAGQVHAELAEAVATSAGNYADLLPGVQTADWAYQVEVPAFLAGDIDGDGRVTISDALMIATYATDPQAGLPPGASLANGDVDGDGSVRMRDALMVATRVLDTRETAPAVEREPLTLDGLRTGDRVVLEVVAEPQTRAYRLSLEWPPDALRLVSVRPEPAGASAHEGGVSLAVVGPTGCAPVEVELQALRAADEMTLQQAVESVTGDFAPGHVAVVAHVTAATAITTWEAQGPATWGLLRSYPNPFNAATTVEYAVPPGTLAEACICDLGGQIVRRLAGSPDGQGQVQRVAWDGRNEEGRQVGTGVYLCQVRTPERTYTRKLLLLR